MEWSEHQLVVQGKHGRRQLLLGKACHANATNVRILKTSNTERDER